MQLQVFSLFDSKAKAYTQPYFMPQKGQALRSLDGIVNNPQTEVYKYPDDFKLYKLADYDNLSGKFIPLQEPEFIANAVEFKKEETQGE